MAEKSGMLSALLSRLLAAVGHAVSSPQTELAVARINANLIREGRRPASVRRRPR